MGIQGNNETKPIQLSTINIVSKDSLEDLNEEIEEKPEFKHLDGGLQAWLVCFATVWAFGINLALEYNFTLIHNELTIVYNSTEDSVVYAAWIGSLTIGIEFLFFLPSSILVDMYGPRVVSIAGATIATVGLVCCGFVRSIYIYFLTYSLVVGSGVAFFTEATFAILPHYFNKRIGIAYGIMNLGSSVIVIASAVMSSEMFEAIGLYNTFYVLAAFTFPTILLSILYKPMLPSEHDEKATFMTMAKQSLGVKVLKKKKFLIWAVSSLVGFFGALIPILTIDHHSEHLFPEANVEILNIVYAAVTGKIHRIYFHTLSFVLLGVSQFCLTFAPSFGALIGIYSIYAIGNGIYYCCLMPIACEVCGDSSLANQGIGYFHAFITLPAILGPTIAGVLFDEFDSYDYAYYIGAGMCILCAILQLFYPSGIIKRLFSREDNNEKITQF